jgi:hypothetical protein
MRYIKYFMAILLPTLACTGGKAYGQYEGEQSVYHITSLDGKSEKVTIVDDVFQDRVLVIYSGDTVRVYDNFYGVESIKPVNKNFLQIKYGCSGGSGMHNDNLFWLCVKNNKLYIPLYLPSYRSFICGERPSEDLYEIKVNMAGSLSSNNLHLNLAIHEKHICEFEPRSHWYNHHKTELLQFDKKNIVFCNKQQYLNKTYKVYTVNRSEPFMDSSYIKAKGAFPQIYLDKNDCHYLINGIWYSGSSALHTSFFQCTSKMPLR